MWAAHGKPRDYHQEPDRRANITLAVRKASPRFRKSPVGWSSSTSMWRGPRRDRLRAPAAPCRIRAAQAQPRRRVARREQPINIDGNLANLVPWGSPLFEASAWIEAMSFSMSTARQSRRAASGAQGPQNLSDQLQLRRRRGGATGRQPSLRKFHVEYVSVEWTRARRLDRDSARFVADPKSRNSSSRPGHRGIHDHSPWAAGDDRKNAKAPSCNSWCSKKSKSAA